MSRNLKILFLDIETSPIVSYTWGLFDQNIPLNQIKKDWHLLSVSCKWLGDPASKTMYRDQSKEKNIENDKKLLEWVWKLLDECHILVTQNGKSFDTKKLNARFIMNGMVPPSSYKQIDTLRLAKKHFGFTSNKLEYMTGKLCKKFKKSKHKKFSGFELWEQCLAGNPEAWKEMEHYNKIDVLSLEELYTKLIPWDNSINFNVYHENEEHVCTCGSKKFQKNGFAYTSTGKFQRHVCVSCGSEVRDRTNLLTKEKKASLKVGTSR